MFDNKLGFNADEGSSIVSSAPAVIRDPYGLDFNSDGRSDLLWHNLQTGENALWLTAGSNGEQIGEVIGLPSTEEGWQVASTADFNRDGQTDLLVRNVNSGANEVWFMGGAQGQERIGKDSLIDGGTDWDIKGVSDFDNNNSVDILWQNRNTGQVGIWYQGGDRGTDTQSFSGLSSPGADWQAQGLADFDGDGRTDIFWRNQTSGENLIWYMHGTGGIDYEGAERLEALPDQSWQVQGVGDFNQDGRPDLFWRSQASGANMVWQMGGNRNSQRTESIRFSDVDNGWVPIVTGEILNSETFSNPNSDPNFNSDGRSDLLWHNLQTGENALWLTAGSNGEQIGEVIGLPSTEEGWQVASTADFNRDGQTDLLVRNVNSGANEVWFMGGAQGQERIGKDSLIDGGTDWDIKGVSDFDNNNSVDILWQNRNTGQVGIWYQGGDRGTDTQSFSGLSSPGADWQAQGLADFDGDGRTDIFWRNQTSGENLIWYMHGTGGIDYKGAERLEALPDQSWQVQGVGDFNQDGRPDLFWRSQASGANMVWQMGGNRNSQRTETIRFSDVDNGWVPIVTGWMPNQGTSVENTDDDELGNNRSDSGSNNNLDSSPRNLSDDDGFNIEFDYRFDINNWYDSDKRAVMEKAADIWEAVILDDFENIAVGTTVHASDPNGGGLTSFQLESEIDDVRVFAFAQDLTSKGALAEAGATTYVSDRNTSTVFQPWLGEVVFNIRESWYVGTDTNQSPTIPRSQADMLSVAVHELGHVLGISSGIEAFRALTENGKFTGEAATSFNNGEAIPLDRRGSHIRDGFEVKGLGENSLDPTIARGTRKLLTALDVALLDDIGYSIDYSTLKPVPEVEGLSIRAGEQDTTKLRVNNSYTIRWEDNFSEAVKIDLLEGNRYVRTIVSSTPSDGQFTWRVPSGLAGDKFYRFRVSSVQDGDIFAISATPFRVEETPFIRVNSPSSGAPLRTGSELTLTWSDNLRETVRIELYKDDSPHRILTASTLSDGNYRWKIPSWLETSDRYHLRFTSTSDSSLYDESAKFSIQKV